MDRRAFLLAGAAATVTACTAGDGDSASVPTTSTSATPTSSAVPTTEVSTTAEVTSTTAARVDRPAHRPEFGTAPFSLGVASGDPSTTSVALWTRLVGDDGVSTRGDGDLGVTCTVARDADLTDIVRAVDASAPVAHGHSVHLVLHDLEPDTTYFFAFDALGQRSPIGRTWTLPVDPASMRLAITSCQHWEDGYFTAWQGVVTDDPDIALQLGDAIYGRDGLRGIRRHPDGIPGDLDSFRRRWALYRTDQEFQAALGSLPYVATWDDNEVRSNYAGDAPYGGVPVDWFSDLRDAAYQAWWEHQPTRLPPPADGNLAIQRTIGFGSLGTVLVLDGRQFRDAQVCEPLDGLPAIERCDDLDTDRTMLGADQERWVDQQVAASAGWVVLAQATVMADWVVEVAGLTGLNHDQWDGYPVARERLLSSLGDRPAVVLSGDVHLGAVNTVRTSSRAVAEFVTPSVSAALDDRVALGLELTVPTLDDVEYFDTQHHGHVVIDLTSDAATATFRHTDPRTPGAVTEAASRWSTSGSGDVRPA